MHLLQQHEICERMLVEIPEGACIVAVFALMQCSLAVFALMQCSLAVFALLTVQFTKPRLIS